MSPTTTRGTHTPTPSEQESHLAKSQLGFIDLFAEPLWAVGATAFFPGMELGLRQIKENKDVWMGKVIRPSAPQQVKGARVGETSSESTAISLEGNATRGKSDEGVRNAFERGDMNGEGKRNIRKERSFSSLIFWRKKGRRQQSEVHQHQSSE